MACCAGASYGDVVVDPEAYTIQHAAKKALQKDRAEAHQIFKILLLGAGESGKSTIFKQMKILNQGGYTDNERMAFISIIASNVINSMATILDAVEKLGMDKSDDLLSLEAKFNRMRGREVLNQEVGALLKTMWAHPMIKEVYGLRSLFQCYESAEYYFEQLDRICSPGYMPTDQDMLKSRVRTTGIVQTEFTINKTNFAMFDVGGQRNERRKWIHTFDDVDALIFVASLSEYDQVLFEDDSTNRLDETLSLFDQIVNSKWFKETSVILFLNKKDVFEEKIKTKPMKKHYAPAADDGAFVDDSSYEQCVQFVRRCFLNKRKNPADKMVFTHITCATDTGNIDFVFKCCVATILEQNLKSSGLV